MWNRGRGVSLVFLGLLGGLLLLAGCTFTVQMPNGRVARVHLPDPEVQLFLSRMDTLSLQLLNESQRLKDDGLKQVVIEVRQVYFRLLQQIGSQRAPANPTELQLKMQAFEMQMARRLTTPQQTSRYQNLKSSFNQLQREIERFSSMVEQAAH